MEKLLGASWKSTVVGFVFGVVTYLHELGPNLPSDGKGWLGVAMAACAMAFGKVVKDFNVTNATIVSPAGVRPETPTPVREELAAIASLSPTHPMP